MGTPEDSLRRALTSDLLDRLLRAAITGYGKPGDPGFDDEENHLRNLAGKAEFSPEDFEWVVEWKQERGFGRKVRRQNPDSSIREVTRAAFARPDVSGAIDALVYTGRSGLKGVQYHTASALLTFHDPERFTILDPRAWSALDRLIPIGRRLDHDSGEVYAAYVSLCQSFAKMHKLSLRELDRALYMLGGSLWMFDVLVDSPPDSRPP